MKSFLHQYFRKKRIFICGIILLIIGLILINNEYFSGDIFSYLFLMIGIFYLFIFIYLRLKTEGSV